MLLATIGSTKKYQLMSIKLVVKSQAFLGHQECAYQKIDYEFYAKFLTIFPNSFM